MATILIIDDEAGVRITLQTMLEIEGHKVLLAEDGLIGIRRMQQYIDDLDLIITDIMMPGANGLSVIKKAQELKEGLPVIAISGGGNRLEDKDPLEAAIELKVDTLRKPFNAEELNEKLEKALA
jgi:DNA-binding NtrC family response regulator